MHFVKKVPTSEEEKAVKQREQAKKAKQFLHVRDIIVAKREKNEFDDEMLSLTQQMLEKNCDIYTFWNIRRTAIELRIAANREIQMNPDVTDEEKTKNSQKIENLLSGELFLSYECIKGNPKSYSAWYQRGWVLQRQLAPDFQKELVLCEKALQMDCRNFHCWDHRRIVAKMAKRTEEEELAFSNKLIDENFSNYSAWHYRSIALKNIHKDEKTGSVRLEDTVVAEELQKVRNAFYMDAEDQSAWTYTRWLLENGSGKEFLRPDSTTPVELISASFHGNNTTLVFSRAITLPKVLTFVDTDEQNGWRAFSSTSPSPNSSRVWQFLSDSPLQVIASESENDWKSITDGPYLALDRLKLIFDVLEVPEPGYIAELLDDCEKLIELEPKNKWPIYMRTLVLIEYRQIRAHSEIIKNLKDLSENLDPKRSELYKALLSRQKLNFCIREQFDRLTDSTVDDLTVRYSELTSLEGIEFLAGIVGSADLAGNKLTDIHRIVLPNLQRLTIDENPVKCLSPSPSLSNLQFLSIANTQISEISDIVPFLQTTPSLNRLVFCETALVEKIDKLRSELPGVRLIPHWL